MPIKPGSYLGRYRITAMLGAGGMGEVYRAQDERLGRDVAIKVLKAEAVADPDRQRRFAQEARAASALNHPNILTVYDIGMEDGIPYIVTEFLDGEALTAPISRGPIPVRKALEIAIQVSSGLSAAHQAGIVHRDLKPANLMTTGDGHVKILDFGLAKAVHAHAAALGATSAETSPGFIVGTAEYMSPEQVRGDLLDHRTDQFSLGLVLYEMLTGKPAFQRSSALNTMAAIVEEPAKPIADLNPAVPAPLRWCVERCLEKDRETRYQSTADLNRELQVIRARVDEISTAAPAPVETPATVRKRRRWPWALAAAVLGAVAGVAAMEYRLPPGAMDLSAYQLIPLSTIGEFPRWPVWSQDGKSIAFIAAVNNVRQVFVRDLSSPSAAQITSSKTDCERPFWSPDETRIYYFTADDEGTHLYSVGATGGAPELVDKNTTGAAISRDGKSLVLLRSDPTGKNPLSMWIRDVNGGEPRQYKSKPFDSASYQLAYLAFAPSGKSLGMWLSRWDGASEFWIVDWPLGEARRPFTNTERAYPFTWMPDGQRIVYGGVAKGSFGSDLQIADIRSGKVRPLSALTKDAVEASVSPAGNRVAFVGTEDNFDVLKVPLDGSPPETLYGSKRAELDPNWAPSGDTIAFSTDRSGTSEIWARVLSNGWDRPLVTDKDLGQDWISSLSEPNFSPDGRRLAFCATIGVGHTIFVSATAGGKPVQLSNEDVDEISPSWNTDGSWIAYLRNNSGRWSLMKALSGGRSAPVQLQSDCLPSHPKWNRANHWIACETRQHGLTLVSDDGKETKALSKEHWLVYGWSADGNTLYGIKQVGPRERVIASLNIESLAEKIIGQLPLSLASEVRGFSLSPDGKSFVTSASHPSGEIWIVSGFAGLGLRK